MNWLEIERLLDRFWKGETSLAEEEQLKNAFSRNDAPAHLSSFKIYFAYNVDQKNIKHPQKDFEQKLLEKLNSKKIGFLSTPKLLAYAAGLLLLMSSLFFLLDNNDASKYKPLTAKEIRVAQKYLVLIANNMEQSAAFTSQKLEKLNMLNKGAQTIQQYETTYNKQIKNLNRIEQIDYSFNQLKYLKAFSNNKIKL
ncbi:MAG: hypothetical protein PF484_03555 [Bacteroidales bacterium]|jgi:hypothetical protein|nr:hypothetical protein [Bacteroidales bacterium]